MKEKEYGRLINKLTAISSNVKSITYREHKFFWFAVLFLFNPGSKFDEETIKEILYINNKELDQLTKQFKQDEIIREIEHHFYDRPMYQLHVEKTPANPGG